MPDEDDNTMPALVFMRLGRTQHYSPPSAVICARAEAKVLKNHRGNIPSGPLGKHDVRLHVNVQVTRVLSLSPKWRPADQVTP